MGADIRREGRGGAIESFVIQSNGVAISISVMLDFFSRNVPLTLRNLLWRTSAVDGIHQLWTCSSSVYKGLELAVSEKLFSRLDSSASTTVTVADIYSLNNCSSQST